MKFNTILLEYQEDIAILTLNRPAVMNSLSPAMAAEVLSAFEIIQNNPAIRALMVTGAGKGFCAGAELGDAITKGNGEQPPSDSLNYNMQHLFNPWASAIEDMAVPVVVAMNGAAAGAGVGVALGADITIAAQSAYFVLSFAPKLGLIPDMGSSWRLPRAIGHAKAKALTLLGEKLSSTQAEQWGLIWKVVPDDALYDEALAIAHQLAALPNNIAKEIRQTYAHADKVSFQLQLDYEREQQCQFVEMTRFKEGVAAFHEKRQPNFKKLMIGRNLHELKAISLDSSK